MPRTPRITVRTAEPADAAAIDTLIASRLAEGHLLPRTLSEITAHASRFVVAVRGRAVVGCAELAPLSPQVAEVRSLAVDPSTQGRGVGTSLVQELRYRARREGYDQLCAFTHAPGYFIPMGFSIVPHLWLTEKVFTDCVKCPKFRQCGQYAMVLPLDSPTEAVDHEIRAHSLHA